MSFIAAVVKAEAAAIIYCKRAIRSWSNCSVVIGAAVAVAVVVVDWVVVIFKKNQKQSLSNIGSRGF